MWLCSTDWEDMGPVYQVVAECDAFTSSKAHAAQAMLACFNRNDEESLELGVPWWSTGLVNASPILERLFGKKKLEAEEVYLDDLAT